jgi:hypothetical protein
VTRSAKVCVGRRVAVDELTNAGTKETGQVLFTVSDGKLTATYKDTGPTPTDQFIQENLKDLLPLR